MRTCANLLAFSVYNSLYEIITFLLGARVHSVSQTIRVCLNLNALILISNVYLKIIDVLNPKTLLLIIIIIIIISQRPPVALVGGGLHLQGTRDLTKSYAHLVGGRPTLHLAILGLHLRTFRPKRPSFSALCGPISI